MLQLSLRHRLLVSAIVGPVAPLFIVVFALNRNDGWIEMLVRVVLLIVVATAVAWLTAGGCDVRYPTSSWFETGARVAGVALLSAAPTLVGPRPGR